MAPIHDTDVAEERWAHSAWKHYELWEKIEQKNRRKKWFWISGVLILYALLSSIPILMDRWPRWTALAAVRKISAQINSVKREAALNGKAYRIVFPGSGLDFVIQRAEHCPETHSSSTAVNWEKVSQGAILPPDQTSKFRLLDSEQGKKMGIPGLVTEFCYDPWMGNALQAKGHSISGIGVIPATDLTEDRRDRIGLLIFEGALAEIQFE